MSKLTLNPYPLHYSMTLRNLLLCFLTLLCTSGRAQPEAAYIEVLAKHLNAQSEIPVNRGRVDLETATNAIEVERAPKWKNGAPPKSLPPHKQPSHHTVSSLHHIPQRP